MAKITELVRRVYRYEQRSAVETAYPSNVLLLLAAIVLVINLCNNSAGDARNYVTKLPCRQMRQGSFLSGFLIRVIFFHAEHKIQNMCQPDAGQNAAGENEPRAQHHTKAERH